MNTCLSGPIKSIRVPQSDVEAARIVTPPRFIKSENSRRFAIMGTAILEKLCRSGRLAIRSKRTTPYILDTPHGKTALSVMVSAVSGNPATKHMLVPITSLPTPPGVSSHVIVCAFVSKYERTREDHGGLNVKLVGWATAEEARKHVKEVTRVSTVLSVASVPVSELHPIQTLRHYLSQPNKETKSENEKTEKQGEEPCVNHASAAS